LLGQKTTLGADISGYDQSRIKSEKPSGVGVGSGEKNKKLRLFQQTSYSTRKNTPKGTDSIIKKMFNHGKGSTLYKPDKPEPKIDSVFKDKFFYDSQNILNNINENFTGPDYPSTDQELKFDAQTQGSSPNTGTPVLHIPTSEASQSPRNLSTTREAEIYNL
jgi:hypothetical protein